MLLEARRAGDALLTAKSLVRHGEFKVWVEANCRCSYRQARKYMTVAKVASRGHFDARLGIDAFLEAHAQPREQPRPEPSSALALFTHEDAEYALKLAAMAERGGTENEREVAQRKLEGFALGFGMTADEAVSRARVCLPDRDITDKERSVRESAEALRRTREELATLRAEMERLVKRRAEVRKEFEAMSHDELLEWAVAKALEEELLK